MSKVRSSITNILSKLREIFGSLFGVLTSVGLWSESGLNAQESQSFSFFLHVDQCIAKFYDCCTEIVNDKVLASQPVWDIYSAINFVGILWWQRWGIWLQISTIIILEYFMHIVEGIINIIEVLKSTKLTVKLNQHNANCFWSKENNFNEWESDKAWLPAWKNSLYSIRK